MKLPSSNNTTKPHVPTTKPSQISADKGDKKHRPSSQNANQVVRRSQYATASSPIPSTIVDPKNDKTSEALSNNSKLANSSINTNVTVKTQTQLSNFTKTSSVFETTVAQVTPLKSMDIQRLEHLLSKEQMATLTPSKENLQTQPTKLYLIHLKPSTENKLILAISPKQLPLGDRIQLSLPTLSRPKLFLLSSITGNNENFSSQVNTNPKHLHTYAATGTPKAVLDSALRHYMPTQLNSKESFSLIKKVVSVVQHQPSSSRSITTLKILNAIQNLEKAPLIIDKTLTDSSVRSAISNSGVFLETKIKAAINKSLNQMDIKSPLLGTRLGAPTLHAKSHHSDIQKSLNNELERIRTTDIKAIILHLIALIKTIPTTQETQVKEHSIPLSALDALLKNLLANSKSKNLGKSDENNLQKKVLESLTSMTQMIQSRITVSQLKTLSRSLIEGQSNFSHTLEIPAKIADYTFPLHLHIEERKYTHQKDKKSKQEKSTTNTQSSNWRVYLEFSFNKLGKFASQIDVSKNTLKSTLWAENPGIREKIEKELPQLASALTTSGIDIQELRCVTQAPTGNPNKIHHNLVDIKT